MGIARQKRGRAVKTLFRILDRTLEMLLFVTLAGMAALVAANVFCRFVLNFSLSWGDELAQVLLVWMTFLGAAVGMRDKAHYAFDYLVKSLPGNAKRIFVLLSEVIVILASIGLLYWSAKATVLIRHWVMPAMEVSRALVYGACPVGTFFLLVYAVKNLLDTLKAGPREAEVTGQEAGL
jgi:TRAP-type C4-dicarboxylate transport system permease small subunit